MAIPATSRYPKRASRWGSRTCSRCPEPSSHGSMLCEAHYRSALRPERGRPRGGSKTTPDEGFKALVDEVVAHVLSAPRHPVPASVVQATLSAAAPTRVSAALRAAVEAGKLRSITDGGPRGSGYLPPERRGRRGASAHAITLTALVREQGRVSRADARRALGISDRSLSRALTHAPEVTSDSRGGLVRATPGSRR